MRPDILTYTGKYFDFFEVSPESICIEDIAHALANTCRFGGHVQEFYSVAQHSVLVSKTVPVEDAKWGLMHDAAEAYLVDVPSPLKALLPDYKNMENHVEEKVLEVFGLVGTKPSSVKRADLILLATEQRDLMAKHDDVWGSILGLTPLKETIVPLSPKLAEQQFLRRFEEIFQ